MCFILHGKDLMTDNEPSGYVDFNYLDITGAHLSKAKQRSYLLMRIAPGHRVLDVGCGPASDTISLGHAVGVAGQVVGVDVDQGMIDEATQRAEAAGIRGRVEHKLADAHALPFDDGFFDSSRCERLFQHLASPERALSEMIRVTRNEGWIVAVDTDWGTLSLDFFEADIERKIARCLAEHVIRHGYSGRNLLRLLREQGLSEVIVESMSIPMTDYSVARLALQLDRVEQEALASRALRMDELKTWRSGLSLAAESRTFFGSVGLVMVAGRKV